MGVATGSAGGAQSGSSAALLPTAICSLRAVWCIQGSVVGAADALLVAKKLEWTMGNVKLPSWQVFGPAKMAGGLLGAMLDISVPGPHGGVQQAIVYSMKEYTSAWASWRKDRVGKPPPPKPAPKKPTAKGRETASESF